MSGAFRVPNSAQHAGVISHSSFGQQLKQPESPMDSVHLYRYYIEQLALQNRALLLHSSPLIPPDQTYFNQNLLQLTNNPTSIFVSQYQSAGQPVLLANQEQM